MESKKIKKDELIKEIKSHNLEKLSKKLSKKALEDLGIKNIRRKNNNGFIEYIKLNNSKSGKD